MRNQQKGENYSRQDLRHTSPAGFSTVHFPPSFKKYSWLHNLVEGDEVNSSRQGMLVVIQNIALKSLLPTECKVKREVVQVNLRKLYQWYDRESSTG